MMFKREKIAENKTFRKKNLEVTKKNIIFAPLFLLFNILN